MFSIKDFFSKCDQIRRKLRIWSQLLKKSLMKKKSLMENSIFCAVSLYCLKRIKKYFSVLEKREYNVD